MDQYRGPSTFATPAAQTETGREAEASDIVAGHIASGFPLCAFSRRRFTVRAYEPPSAILKSSPPISRPSRMTAKVPLFISVLLMGTGMVSRPLGVSLQTAQWEPSATRGK